MDMLKVRRIVVGEIKGLLTDGATPRAMHPDRAAYVIVDELGRQYDCTGGLNGTHVFGHTVFCTVDLAQAVLCAIKHLAGNGPIRMVNGLPVCERDPAIII